LALAPELLREFKDAQMVIYGVLLILCVQFLPSGLVSLIDVARSVLRRKPHAAP
jgi:ABC-type branched-subunit amino acid transport system permease subunit